MILTVRSGFGLSIGLNPAWAGAAALMWPVIIAVLGGYDRNEVGVGTKDIGAVLRAVVYLIAAAALVRSVFNADGIVTLLVVAAPVAAGVSLVARLGARRLVHRRQYSGALLRDVVVVGSLEGVRHLVEVLEREPYCGLRAVGVCVPRVDVPEGRRLGLNVLGDLEDVAGTAALAECDGIAVTAGHSPEFLRRLSWSLEEMDIDLYVHPGLVEVAGPRMHLRPYVGLPLLHVEQPHFTGWRRVVKRATDVTLTAGALVLAAPVMVVVALLIKLGDRGPVFFTQTRVGLDGETFKVYKFRTMVRNAESLTAQLKSRNEVDGGVLFKLHDDPRVTRVGGWLRKYSLDELPQLFNVLRGDMSLVGPRPPLPAEVDQYPADVHRRLLVKPGLTGLWQVSGRSLLTWEESVRLDLRYVENWCLSMDLLLLWKTVGAVLAKRGAF
ncbi:exopolysaccharide biosynthesis polyprenyl glycosylphosphotransferase [Epidermidibacterium keratini]|uniref:Exopolysaccharide biosynthesis polyprenyl glycosylphosphotransferase n=1 Tax=Epidermidibacterium keratini TaxID=1891644 RepID=A0A7L4YMN8_9ACTN|nr:sugar transferase [Epidermidibacterium keratini]QHC00143.1 exopolysaccharide biosynthesis polyprenyl glycosylphosphotransferase [Epidermidibacterium keratini]